MKYDDIETMIGFWSMRPPPLSAAGQAWEDGARQGWRWALDRMRQTSEIASSGLITPEDLPRLTVALEELSRAAEAWARRGGDEAHRILPLIHPSFSAVYEAYRPIRAALAGEQKS